MKINEHFGCDGWEHAEDFFSLGDYSIHVRLQRASWGKAVSATHCNHDLQLEYGNSGSAGLRLVLLNLRQAMILLSGPALSLSLSLKP